VGLAGPASAHVEVTADRPQAGAKDVTVTFMAESESRSAGITALRVVMPTGLAPASVTYVSGPPGWTLTPANDGYTVAGPAAPAGQDATYVVKFAEFPTDATRLGFKTLQTYTGGRVDRWIEIPEPGGPTPENPAPVLALKPVAPAPTTAPPSPTSSPTTAAPTSQPAESNAAAPADEEGPAPLWPWLAGGALLLAGAAAAGLWWTRRHQTTGAGPGDGSGNGAA